MALSIAFWLVACGLVSAQARNPQVLRIEGRRPMAGSVVTIVSRGFGGIDLRSLVVTFSRGGVALRGRIGQLAGGDDFPELAVDVEVPTEVDAGRWLVTLTGGGVAAKPKSRRVHRAEPTVLQAMWRPVSHPGDLVVAATAATANALDEVVLRDATGTTWVVRPQASRLGLIFTLPQDLTDGLVELWARRRVSGVETYGNSLRLPVTKVPIPLDSTSLVMRSAAPGEWTDLEARIWFNEFELEGSDRVEVEFEQRGKVHYVDGSGWINSRVLIPLTLRPGKAKVRVRTYRGVMRSEWSTPLTVRLAEKASTTGGK